MVVENEWRKPATKYDEDYKINVTALAMVELDKGKTFETTGKENEGNEYRDIIRSDELTEGMTIVVEDNDTRESENTK